MKTLSAEIPGGALPHTGQGTATTGLVPAPPGEVTSVPEPSPLFLLVGALALVFLLKRGGGRRS